MKKDWDKNLIINRLTIEKKRDFWFVTCYLKQITERVGVYYYLLRRSPSSFLLNLEILFTSSNETSSSGGDETDLLTVWGESADGWGVTNVLLVTTTMRMVYGVHSNTSNSWPCTSSLCLPFVVWVASFADWLIGSATTGNNSNHGSAVAWDGSSCSWWKSNSGLLAVVWVTNDDGWGTWSSSEGASVSGLGLTVGHDGTFWELIDW